ncbi:follistatin-A-like isoform X1 [Mizuhopecten yessoensis]|uniref:follistatin-A-like isoform X1 n=1 Tax=Mizuhopecten yessoensis TaxID=6573 RepID=UPI000B45F2FE|nr:follistatin-A-like isoform X1 [Mizuhopecten yessoensis]
MILCFGLMDTYTTCHHSIHLILLMSLAGYVSGGLCWANISPSNTCSTLYRANITQEDCCRRTFSPSLGWSPSEFLTNGQVFYWRALMRDISNCHRCHNSCANIRCAPGRVCRMRKGVPKCVCRPRCTGELRKRGALCGTDSVNYKNYCHMLKRNCRKNQRTNVAYFGKCKRACKKVKCLAGTQCLEDQNGLPHCVRCRSVCPVVTNPNFVCGDDQVSYPSVCHVRAAICVHQTSIRIAYGGRCRENATCSDTMCPENYQCLVNRNTLQPLCVNCRMKCSPMSTLPVCGTDGVTYDTYCQLFRTACESGVFITTKHSGHCNSRKRAFNKTCKKCRRKRRRKHRRRQQRRYKTSVGYYKVNVYNAQKSGKSERVLKLRIIPDPDSLSRNIS